MGRLSRLREATIVRGFLFVFGLLFATVLFWGVAVWAILVGLQPSWILERETLGMYVVVLVIINGLVSFVVYSWIADKRLRVS